MTRNLLSIAIIAMLHGCTNWGGNPDGGIDHWTPPVRCADAEMPYHRCPAETPVGPGDGDVDTGDGDRPDADAGSDDAGSDDAGSEDAGR